MFLSFLSSLVLRCGLRGLPCPLFNVVVVNLFVIGITLMEKHEPTRQCHSFLITTDLFMIGIYGMIQIDTVTQTATINYKTQQFTQKLQTTYTYEHRILVMLCHC